MNRLTIFDKAIREQLVDRINNLDDNCQARWGKMNYYQMLKHNTIWNEWVLGLKAPVYKQELLGLLFGKLALRGMVKDERPMKKNMPAGRGFIVKEKSGDSELHKQNWIYLVREYANYSNPRFIHDFFGKMTRDEIGILAFKHTDHHLRQFGG